MTAAVELTGVRREFPARSGTGSTRVALDDVDLAVARGETHGLLGPNGAGKTTLVRILSTVLLPTGGDVRVLGHDVVRDPKAVRGRIGIVFGDDRGLYWRISARENLLFWAAMFGLRPKEARRRAAELIDRFGLGARADQPVEQYSRGMKQRLHLARGLIGDPEMLLLDEPTIGMDPVGALEFRRIVRDLRGDGRTIFLTTHDMAEAEAVCDRVSLIDSGRLLITERTADVGHLLTVPDRIDFATVDESLVEELRARPDVREVCQRGDLPNRWRLVPAPAASVKHLMALMLDRGVTTMEAAPPRLEEVYLSIIGPRGFDL